MVKGIDLFILPNQWIPSKNGFVSLKHTIRLIRMLVKKTTNSRRSYKNLTNLNNWLARKTTLMWPRKTPCWTAIGTGSLQIIIRPSKTTNTVHKGTWLFWGVKGQNNSLTDWHKTRPTNWLTNWPINQNIHIKRIQHIFI